MPDTATIPAAPVSSAPAASPVTGGLLHLPALVAYRREAARRRAAAFCDKPDGVLGIPVQPLTPRTFSMLLANGNRFIVGGGQPRIEDVIDYLWFHSATYTHTGVPGWAERKRRAVRPLTQQIRQPWRKWVGLKPDVHRITAALALAITDIRELVDEAFADSTSATGRPGAAVATLEATFVHVMGAAYGWSAEITRQKPLRELFQLNRCIRAARGEDVTDDGERAILASHLWRRNETLRLAREATQQPVVAAETP